MTEPLTIPRGERHVLRVFALDMDAGAAEALRNRPPSTDPLARLDPSLRHADRAAVAALFGVDEIDPAHVDLLDTADLGDVGLAAYLAEGLAVAEDQIAADRARLNARQGLVLAVATEAFTGRPVTLRPAPGLTLIGSYREDVAPVRFDPLPDASARGVIGTAKAAPGQPPRGRPFAIPLSVWLLAALLVAALGAILLA